MYISLEKYINKMVKNYFHKFLKNYKSSQILGKYMDQSIVFLLFPKIKHFLDGERINLDKLQEPVNRNLFLLHNH